jgi:hypothetical protein
VPIADLKTFRVFRAKIVAWSLPEQARAVVLAPSVEPELQGRREPGSISVLKLIVQGCNPREASGGVSR